MAAVFGRYGTGPRSFGATFWNPGVKTEETAKKWRKNEQKWARNSLTKRVRAALLCLRNRYNDLGGRFEAAEGEEEDVWSAAETSRLGVEGWHVLLQVR